MLIFQSLYRPFDYQLNHFIIFGLLPVYACYILLCKHFKPKVHIFLPEMLTHKKKCVFTTIQNKPIASIGHNSHGNPLHNSSIGVDIFFSLILSYFCRLVAAFRPCQGKLPRRKYMNTQPSDSMSSRRLCSVIHIIMLIYPCVQDLAHFINYHEIIFSIHHQSLTFIFYKHPKIFSTSLKHCALLDQVSGVVFCSLSQTKTIKLEDNAYQCPGEC